MKTVALGDEATVLVVVELVFTVLVDVHVVLTFNGNFKMVRAGSKVVTVFVVYWVFPDVYT